MAYWIDREGKQHGRGRIEFRSGPGTTSRRRLNFYGWFRRSRLKPWQRMSSGKWRAVVRRMRDSAEAGTAGSSKQLKDPGSIRAGLARLGRRLFRRRAS